MYKKIAMLTFVAMASCNMMGSTKTTADIVKERILLELRQKLSIPHQDFHKSNILEQTINAYGFLDAWEANFRQTGRNEEKYYRRGLSPDDIKDLQADVRYHVSEYIAPVVGGVLCENLAAKQIAENSNLRNDHPRASKLRQDYNNFCKTCVHTILMDQPTVKPVIFDNIETMLPMVIRKQR